MTGCGTERYADWFFDLDGTLVDSAPDILRLLGGVLREEGLAVPELDKGRIGPLLEDIIRGICPDLAPADLERIVRIYRARYRACPFDESPAFPGIPPLFERLSGRGCRLFVATNKPEDVTRRLLDVRGLLPFLAGFACSDSLPGRRSGLGCWPCSWNATAWSRRRRLWSGTGARHAGGQEAAWPRLRPCTGMGGVGRCSKPGLILSL
ncbi:HAD family hydrolase [Bilophila wadsworthia]|uniref:HAD family hydrolase n=1 Tax=Bilophila wadsworthia TaxID=35833 RepID=UPI00399CD5AD